MPNLSFKVPRSRLFKAKPEFSAPNTEGDLVQANDIIISVSFGRIAATDGNTYELIAKYNPIENCMEIDVPDHVLEFLEKVDFGPNFRRFLNWLLDIDLNVGPGASVGDVLVRNDDGQWVPVNVLPQSFTFVAADWDTGTANEILINGSGAAGPGEIGPHSFDSNGPYQVITYSVSGSIVTEVDVEVETNVSNGNVVLRKAGGVPSFDGRVVIASII